MRSRRGTAASPSRGMGGLVWGGVREDGVVQSQTQMHSPCVVPNHQNDYHQRREQCKWSSLMIIVIINMITIVIIRWNVFASALAFLCVVGGLGGPHSMFVCRWQGPAVREWPGRAPTKHQNSKTKTLSSPCSSSYHDDHYKSSSPSISLKLGIGIGDHQLWHIYNIQYIYTYNIYSIYNI